MSKRKDGGGQQAGGIMENAKYEVLCQHQQPFLFHQFQTVGC